MNIVCFGQQNWDYTWTEKQQYMTRLARRGHRILYVDPAWSYDVAAPKEQISAIAPIRSGFGLREVGPGSLYVFTYHFAPLLRWRVNVWRYPKVLRALARRLCFDSPVVVAFHPRAVPLLPALQPRALLYYAVDEYTAYGGLPEEERHQIRAWEETILRESDVALAVSPRLVRRFEHLQPRSYLLENGVDPEYFAMGRCAGGARHPALKELPTPRLALLGQIDERVDQSLLISVARARPDWQTVLIGRIKEGVDVSALAAEPNIHFVEFQSYEALPAVLKEIDVALVPYRQTVLTHSCNPAKIIEYLAADRPVVSTPLEGIVSCRDAISLAATPEEFLRAVEAALADPSAGREARRAVTAASNWDLRTDQLEDRLEEALEVAEQRRGTSSALVRSVKGRQIKRLPDPPERVNDYQRRTPGAPLPSTLSRSAFAVTRAAGWLYYALRVAARTVRGQHPVAVRRILVVRDGTYLGDLIALLPMLHSLRARYPQARIVLAVQPNSAAGTLVGTSHIADEVRVLDFLARPSRVAQLAGMIRFFLEGFDVVIFGLSYTLRQEAIYSGAPYRIGPYDGHPLQRLNSRVLPLDTTQHVADANLALVEVLTGRPEDVRRIPEIELDPAAVGEGAQRLISELGIPPQAEILTVHAGSKKPSRRWPAERFAELVTRLLLQRPQLWVVFSGTPGERELVESIRDGIPPHLRARAVSSVGRTDLPTLVGLLDRCTAIVSNDTGVMHLARARGTPLVALLGPEHDRRWGPYPWGIGPAIVLRHEVPCSRCARESCETLFCMRSLPVDEVAAEVAGLLDAAGSSQRERAGTAVTSAHRRSGVYGRGTNPAHSPALIPVTRRVRRLSWLALAEAGFSLPSVSVVIPGDSLDPPIEGESATSGTANPSDSLAAAVAMLERQNYPRIEVLVAAPRVAGSDPGIHEERSTGGLPIRTVPVSEDDPEAAWRAVLAAARGEVIVPFTPRLRWDTGKISADIAALMREPEATITVSHVRNGSGGVVGKRHRVTAAARRAALESLFAERARSSAGESAGEDMLRWFDAQLSEAVPAYIDASLIRIRR